MRAIPTSFQRATLLLVQDVPAQLELERTFLRRHDLLVITASTADDALRIARHERPALAVLDLADRDGTLVLCRELKRDAATSGIPVIVVLPRTAHRAGEEAGADGFVFKPVVQREFLDVVRRFVPLTERRVRRAVVNLRFSWRAGDLQGQAFSRDLSPSGAFLKSDRLLAPGTEVHLRFVLPGDEREIACGARVRNASDLQFPGFGVEFETLTAEDRVRLERFVEGVMRRATTVS